MTRLTKRMTAAFAKDRLEDGGDGGDKREDKRPEKFGKLPLLSNLCGSW